MYVYTDFFMIIFSHEYTFLGQRYRMYYRLIHILEKASRSFLRKLLMGKSFSSFENA